MRLSDEIGKPSSSPYDSILDEYDRIAPLINKMAIMNEDPPQEISHTLPVKVTRLNERVH
jgi:hypothetical protein